MMKKKKKEEGMNVDKNEQVKDVNETTVENQQAGETQDKKDNTQEQQKELTPEQVIEEQKKKIDELNDKYLRLYAEFDNYRRRTLKERVELIQTSSAEIILALLPVLDDFDRAITAIEKSNNIDALNEGVVLVNNKLRNVLDQKGLEEMKSYGEVFNSELHDAVANTPAPTEEQKGRIIDVVEKGYYLNGKILRYAKVVVGS
jgi:molecular chaperone GrpE